MSRFMDEADNVIGAARNEEPKEVTIEEFVKKYRELYDMARYIDGIDEITFRLHYFGAEAATQKIKALIDYEMAESNKVYVETRSKRFSN